MGNVLPLPSSLLLPSVYWLIRSYLCELAALGSGILFTYPQISTIAGVQGLVVYTIASALPLLIFGYLGPIIRRKCPEGFVLTEWTRQRYGVITASYLSILTFVVFLLASGIRYMLTDHAISVLTIFLYMVAELSALQQIVNALTGLDGLPVVIVQVVVTTIYTCECLIAQAPSGMLMYPALGGFRISFVTDNIQATMVVGLIVIAVITVGVETKIDRSLVDSSGLLEASLLGWQLIYILPVAILTNDFLISGFWMRTFASKTDKDLRIGVLIASIAVAIILLLVGMTGLLAAWTGAWPGDPPQDGSIAFFLLLGQLPSWVVGIVIVMTVSLSTAAFDSFQSAMVSTISNDLFRNRLGFWWIRLGVVLVIVPVIVVALRSPSILQIYLISDLLSASFIPVLVIGLNDRFYWWRGFEVIVGGLGGLLSVFIFGTVYFGNTSDGAKLLLLENGLYGEDWSAFGRILLLLYFCLHMSNCTQGHLLLPPSVGFYLRQLRWSCALGFRWLWLVGMVVVSRHLIDQLGSPEATTQINYPNRMRPRLKEHRPTSASSFDHKVNWTPWVSARRFLCPRSESFCWKLNDWLPVFKDDIS